MQIKKNSIIIFIAILVILFLVYYLSSNIKEKFTNNCSFDAVKYADFYPDLKKAFGYDAAKLKNHYDTYGKNEGRSPCGGLLKQIKLKDIPTPKMVTTTTFKPMTTTPKMVTTTTFKPMTTTPKMVTTTTFKPMTTTPKMVTTTTFKPMTTPEMVTTFAPTIKKSKWSIPSENISITFVPTTTTFAPTTTFEPTITFAPTIKKKKWSL